MQNVLVRILGQAWQTLLNFFDLSVFILAKIKIYSGEFLALYKIAYVFLQKLSQDIISLSIEKYIFWKPILIEFSLKNRIVAAASILILLLILIFWIRMLRHARQIEPTWKKLWTFIVFILGPLGAILYYFCRKGYLERKENKHNKLMMSFFTPMNVTSTNSKKNSD